MRKTSCARRTKNTTNGSNALHRNNTGSSNTAIGYDANAASGDLTNATAVGTRAVVDLSNKIRLGDTNVTVIEGQVGYTFTSDRTKKEHFRSVDLSAVLNRMRGIPVTSRNYIGQDAQLFRHYGPMAQDVFAAFGRDGVGVVGSQTTINAGDLMGILMLALQALDRQTQEQATQINDVQARLARLEALLVAVQQGSVK